MKKLLATLTTIILAANLTACSGSSANTGTNEVLSTETSSETPTEIASDTTATEPTFTEYYSDPDTGLEYKLRTTTTKESLTEYNYVAKHIAYEGPYESSYWGDSVSYYLKKDSHNENYYKVFDEINCNLHIREHSNTYDAWLEDVIEEKSNRTDWKDMELYKFELDETVPSIKLEKNP